MASNHTKNYNLCQWEATDTVVHTDFNEDNQKLDAALAQENAAWKEAVAAVTATVPKIAMGTYTGNGAASRTISLNFTPKAVFVCTQWGETSYYSPGSYYGYGGLALEGHPAQLSYSAGGETTVTDLIIIIDRGFQVVCTVAQGTKAYSNYNKEVYHYIAIG